MKSARVHLFIWIVLGTLLSCTDTKEQEEKAFVRRQKDLSAWKIEQAAACWTMEQTQDWQQRLAALPDDSAQVMRFVDEELTPILHQCEQERAEQKAKAKAERRAKAEHEFKWVIKPRFDSAWSFTDNGLARVKVNDKFGFINEKGEEVIKPRFDSALDFSDNGLAAIGVNKQYGYINKRGKEVIKPRFDMAEYFVNDLAPVMVNGQYGYINEKGTLVIEPRFDGVEYFASNGLALFRKESFSFGTSSYLYSQSPTYSPIMYGYINKKGEVVIHPNFLIAMSFSANGLAAVNTEMPPLGPVGPVWLHDMEKALDGKFGYINEQGKLVIPARFDSAEGFAANGLAAVKINGKFGYINEKGEEVIEPRFDEAADFAANGLAAVKINDKFGYINEKGEEVIEPRFDEAADFATNGLARVKVDSEVGYINEQGKEIISPYFDEAADFAANGLALVKVDGKWGYIRARNARTLAR
jgi:hypothetical protein